MIIQPANRTNSVSEYYFSRKLREIDEMNRLGEKVISLGIGSPDMAPAYEVIHTLIHGAENPENHAYQSYNPGIAKGFCRMVSKILRCRTGPRKRNTAFSRIERRNFIIVTGFFRQRGQSIGA